VFSYQQPIEAICTTLLPDIAFSPFSKAHRKHGTYECRHCSEVFSRGCDLNQHTRDTHTSLFECQQCHFIFDVLEHLNRHALKTKHEAFRCSNIECLVTFTRMDDLRRHNKKHQPDAQDFPCPHCQLPTKSFKRKDHLTQHLRNFHRIGVFPGTSLSARSCPRISCPQFRSEDGGQLVSALPFRHSKEYIDHMRRTHDESPFPCPESGCNKIGGKGYFREMDLVKHRKKSHTTVHVLENENLALSSSDPIADQPS
jgi:hypothetical protein